MKRYLLLYSGPPTPPNPSHEGWAEWFEKLGDALVDLGSPMVGGFRVRPDGSTDDAAHYRNGYCIVEVEDRADLVALVSDHPFLALGGDHAIEIFEVPKR
jgi:hypothetical protein